MSLPLSLKRHPTIETKSLFLKTQTVPVAHCGAIFAIIVLALTRQIEQLYFGTFGSYSLYTLPPPRWFNMSTTEVVTRGAESPSLLLHSRTHPATGNTKLTWCCTVPGRRRLSSTAPDVSDILALSFDRCRRRCRCCCCCVEGIGRTMRFPGWGSQCTNLYFCSVFHALTIQNT